MIDTILERLVEEDFGIASSTLRWSKSEDHSSLVVDKEKNLFYWNSRGIVGGPLDYLMKVRGMPFKEAKSYLKHLGYGDTVIYTINEHDKEDVIVYPKLVSAFWENGKENRTYWYDRKFTDITIDRFQLGYYDGWYTIPLFMNNVLRNFQKRRDVPKKEIKNWYRGVGPVLFQDEVLRYTDKVYLTEGPTDAIALLQQGIPAVSQTGGSENWQNDWFPNFVTQKEIFIVYDNDPAGVNGAKVVSKKLGIYRSRIYTFDNMDKGYDPVDFFRDGGTKEEFLTLIDEKAKYIYEIEEDKSWTKKFMK